MTADEYEACVAPFMANGRGGVRAVKQRLERFLAYRQEDLSCPEDVFVRWVNGQVSWEHVRAMSERAKALTSALASHGLALRSDSRLCAAFVREGQGALGDVVATMVEMDMLHKYTNYRQVYKRVVRDMTDHWDWMPRDAYDQAIDAIRDEVSQRAREIARRQLPEKARV